MCIDYKIKKKSTILNFQNAINSQKLLIVNFVLVPSIIYGITEIYTIINFDKIVFLSFLCNFSVVFSCALKTW